MHVFKRKRSTWTTAALGGLVIAGSGLLVGIPEASPAGAAPNARMTPLETRSVSLRASMGLDDDLDHVRAVASSADSTTSDLGIALSPAEHLEMRRRAALGSRVRSIDSSFTSDPTYAGAWLDQAAGGVLRVAFTRKPGAAGARKLAAQLLSGQAATTQVVAHSLRQLDSIEARVTADIVAATAKHQSTEVSAGVDLAANAVTITIAADAPAAAEGAVLARFGPSGVVVTRGNAATLDDGRNFLSGRLFGGEWITSSTSACTVTYADAKSAYNETYAITAGHCGANGTRFYQGYGTRGIGTVHSDGTYGHTETECDCAPVGPTPAPGFGTNQVLINNNELRTLTAYDSTYQGEVVCQSGASSYDSLGSLQCGPVADNAFSTQEATPDRSLVFVLYDCVEVDAHAQGGDSGAPIIAGSSLVGIMSASVNSSISVFSRATHVPDVGLHLSFAT